MLISKDFPNERTESLLQNVLFHAFIYFAAPSSSSNHRHPLPKHLVYLYLCTHFIQGAKAPAAHAIQSSNEINKVKLRLVKSMAGFCVHEIFLYLKFYCVFGACWLLLLSSKIIINLNWRNYVFGKNCRWIRTFLPNWFHEINATQFVSSWMWRAAVELTEAIETTTTNNNSSNAIAIDTLETAVKTIIKKDEQKAPCTPAPIFYKSITVPKSALCSASDKKQFMQNEKKSVYSNLCTHFIHRSR